MSTIAESFTMNALVGDAPVATVDMTPHQLLCIYRSQRTVLDSMRVQFKKQSTLVKDSEVQIIAIMQHEKRVVVPYDDTQDIHLQNKQKKPPSNVERFTDILFDVETSVNQRSESDVHQYIDMLLKKVETSRSEETEVVPTLKIMKKRRRGA